MSAKDSNAKVNTAKDHLERASREVKNHRKAAAHLLKASELFEGAGDTKRSADALLSVIERAEKKRWELLRRPKFDA